jgi:transcriptional regulator with XRE-family HTH domain/tetratricopeptide (TPR) repeat protein
MTSAGTASAIVRTPNTRLRMCREDRGWSQERLASELRRFAVSHEGREAGVTGNMVCKWEKGDKKPSLRYQRLLRALTHLTSADLGFIDDETSLEQLPHSGTRTGFPAVDPAVERRSFLRMVAAASGAAVAPVQAESDPWDRLSTALRRQNGITPGMVIDLSTRTAGLYSLEERVPAHALRDRVSTHLDELSALLEASPRSALRRDLAATAGETAALAGWLAFDMHDIEASRSYYRVALEAAREADDNALWACVLGYESYQSSAAGRPDKACALLAEAQHRAANCPTPMTRAWLAAREAEEQAARGDAGSALRALDRAQDAFGDAKQRGEDRVWTHFFDQGRLDGLRVTTYSRLGRSAAAYSAATAGLRAAGPGATKKRSLLLGDVALVHIKRGEIDQATQLLADALAIVAQTDFSMGLARVRQVRDRLRPWHYTAPIRDLDEQLRALS